MNLVIKKPLEIIFGFMVPLLKPSFVQRALRNIGFRIPYRLAKKLNYKGIVSFTVNNKVLNLQSHNTPIEIFIFWYGIFGIWEAAQLRIWSHLVKQHDYILDIGANTGVYSLIASTNETAKIFAFEPVPDVRLLLVETCKINNLDKVKIIPAAVGDSDGFEKIYMPSAGWTDTSSLDKDFASHYVTEGFDLLECQVPSVTVSSFLQTENIPKKSQILCKIDVEGAEDRVVAGLLPALDLYNIVFTLELLTEVQFTSVCKQIPARYNIYAINEKNHRLESTTGFNIYASNYLFSPQIIDTDTYNVGVI